MKSRYVFVLAALALFAAGPLRAETAEQWIAKARAFVGSESALNAVTSIHFTGRLETTEKVPSAEDKSKLVDQPLSMPIDLVFQKPYQQRITITGTQVTETSGLDGYEAWQKRVNLLNPSQWQFNLLDATQVKRLRANTWENLCYFAGIEKKGGTVRLGGDVTVDGLACVKLSFIHADNIIFHRYFEKATGRLIKTETESGGEIREEGEIIVKGVRFSRKVINKAANGTVTIITFDQVVLNEQIPAAEFAVPDLKAN